MWDARAIIMLVIGILNLIVLLASITSFIKLLGNDLKHVNIDLKKVETLVHKIYDKFEKFGERIASIETRCKERHPRVLKAKKKK